VVSPYQNLPKHYEKIEVEKVDLRMKAMTEEDTTLTQVEPVVTNRKERNGLN